VSPERHTNVLPTARGDMVELEEAGFVLGTGLLAWLAAVTATDGWSEPVIIFWAAIITFGLAAGFLVAEHVELPI